MDPVRGTHTRIDGASVFLRNVSCIQDIGRQVPVRLRDPRPSGAPERFGNGALEGVAAPEASAHSKTQVAFIPTMNPGSPGDAVMALIPGALLIPGIQPGPRLIAEHADLFWGLAASFWVGTILLVILNVPSIGAWMKLPRVPFRLMFRPRSS